MLKLKVTEKSGAVCEYQSPVELDYSALGHGLPERWVLASSPHDPSEVIAAEQREIDGVLSDWVKLKAEYTVEVTDITAQLAQEQVNRESEEYLKATDWYIIRELDSGVSCPAEIKALRAQARASIIR